MRIGDHSGAKPPQTPWKKLQNDTVHNKQHEHKGVRQDKFDRSAAAPETASRYTSSGADEKIIERLREDSDRAYGQLRQLVEQLLQRQGRTWEQYLSDGTDVGTEIVVDSEAQLEAESMISEGGTYSPEAVSGRIFEFAEALADGDSSKMEMLREAVEDGFEAAAEVLGGALPAISETTYEMVMDQFDAWTADAE